MKIATHWIFIISCMAGMSAMGQAPKREFRAVWIATVKNIDWPSQTGLSTQQQKDEFLEILDYHKMNGFNAVIVQVRPGADAFYASEMEPWSRYLSGVSGKAPEPFYDPLTFMVDAAHERGLEFHAWFNPYRAVVDLKEMPEDSTNLLYQHPEWFLTYGDKMYFDPGIPAVQEFTVEVIKDVVSRYDIDAVHFDDYFYPYRIEGVEFPDSVSFREFGKTFSASQRDDWRRENVNTIIRLLNDSIKATKPWVKFGISPFGVWRNKRDDARGSESDVLQTNYDDLFADVLKWMHEGWIDYVLPQLYLYDGHPRMSFGTMLDWWDQQDYFGHLYIGHGAYRVGSKDSVWQDPQEIPRQIALTRNKAEGSAFFSSKSLTANPLGLSDDLRQNAYAYPALVPAMTWLDSVPPEAPVMLTAVNESAGNYLTWEASDPSVRYFLVYRFKGKKAGDLNDPAYILNILPVSHPFFLDQRVKKHHKYTYVITATDRLFNESKGAADRTVKVTGKNPSR